MRRRCMDLSANRPERNPRQAALRRDRRSHPKELLRALERAVALDASQVLRAYLSRGIPTLRHCRHVLGSIHDLKDIEARLLKQAPQRGGTRATRDLEQPRFSRELEPADEQVVLVRRQPAVLPNILAERLGPDLGIQLR